MLSLSPPEAVGTFNGFIVAGIVGSILIWIPRILVVYSLLNIALAIRNGADDVVQRSTRFAIAIAVLALFWPGAVTGPEGTSVTASEFISAAARADGASIQTAADTQSALAETAIPVGPGTRLVVQALSEGWLNIAIGIWAEALKPFSSVQPLQWLMTQGLTAGNVARIRDWTEKCVIPAQRLTLESGTAAPTYQNMLPFPGTPVAAQMDNIEVMPGVFFGTLGFATPFAGAPTSCSNYTDEVVENVEEEIAITTSPGGTPLLDLFDAELGVTTTEVAHKAIMMEVLRTSAIVPAPSLRGIFLGAAAIRTLTSTTGSTLEGFFRKGTAGAVAAGANALNNQLIVATDALMSLVGPALLVTEFAPDLLGLAMTVMIGGLPILLSYVLIPGRQAILTPVIAYIVVLSMLYSSPVWWAIIELTARSHEATAVSIMASPLAWAKGKAAGLLIRTLGIGVVILSFVTVVSVAAGISGVAIVRSLRRV